MFLALASAVTADASLVAVQAISRHGTRAPDDVTEILCPKDPNLNKWPVEWSSLTGKGMTQLHELGELMKDLYANNTGEGNFLNPVFRHGEMQMQAASSSRCQQSAVSMGQGFFPESCAPEDYEFSAPVPYSCLLEDDNILEAKKWGCKPKVKALMKQWQAEKGDAIVQANKALVDKVGAACGADFFNDGEADVFSAIKDVNDALIFTQVQR